MRQLILGKNRLPVTVQTIVGSAYKVDTSADDTTCLENMKDLYLTVMQNLVELSGEDPLKEDDEGDTTIHSYDQRAWRQLALRARELGFDSDEISRLSDIDSDQQMAKRALLDARPPQHFDYGQNIDTLVAAMVKSFNEARPIKPENARLAFTTSHLGEPIKRRCGRQYSKAYSNDRSYITLANFTCNIQKGGDVASLFVRRSVFYAFWGWCNKQGAEEQSVHSQRTTHEQDQQMLDVDETV